MPADTTFAEVAARHAHAIDAYFGEPVDILGHSTGGSLLLQLVADRPDVVRKAVVACAAYSLGPVGRRAQLSMLPPWRRPGTTPPMPSFTDCPAGCTAEFSARC